MPLPDSTLHQACQALADYLRSGLQAAANDIHIYLGAPAEVAAHRDQHRLGLFFYRFEPSGFQANAHPRDPWQVRLHCMISCMAAEESIDNPGADDLRLLGLVMALFHEHPLLPPVSLDSERLHLEVVFRPASDEQLNQLWSIQGDTAYRPSLLYEIALAQVMPERRRNEPPRVGTFGLETGADPGARSADFGGVLHAPLARARRVDPNQPGWAPLVCWVEDGDCVESLTLDVTITDPADFQPALWIAGVPGTTVSLEWQVWQGERWQAVVGGERVIDSPAIDPAHVPVALPGIALPALELEGRERWQLLLHVSRAHRPVPGGPVLLLRSNPLLISLYRGA